jgi:hypothetical protein
MTPRQTAILTALTSGPATTEELAYAAGFSCVDRHAQSYVTLNVSRLVRIYGYRIDNVFMPGSHKRALYTLVGVPGEHGVCYRCGAYLARDNRDSCCSPCARTLAAREMAAEWATA